MNFRSLNISTKLILSVAIGVILGIIVLVSTVSIYIFLKIWKKRPKIQYF